MVWKDRTSIDILYWPVLSVLDKTNKKSDLRVTKNAIS